MGKDTNEVSHAIVGFEQATVIPKVSSTNIKQKILVRLGGGGVVFVHLVFVKRISISRCGRALYGHVVDDLQKVKVILVTCTARQDFSTVAMKT